MSFSFHRSSRSSRFPRLSVHLPVAAALLAVAGCSSGSSNVVAVPSPSPDQAVLCRALHGVLPRTVNGLARRATKPVSDFTAAWGDPAIVLRCGVPTPAVLTPGTPHYDPTTQAVDVNSVTWLPEKQPDGSVRCTTTLRKVYVEVTIPQKYAGPYLDIGSLTDLASAVRSTIPTGL